MGVIDNAVGEAIRIANSSEYGYSQQPGRGYDCVSLIIHAYKSAGVSFSHPDGDPTYVLDMWKWLDLGFKDVTDSVMPLSSYGKLRKGDVLRSGSHAALYCGNGYLVEALQSEGMIVDGQTIYTDGIPGDQLQLRGDYMEEIVHWPYRYSNTGASHWVQVFRFNGETSFACSRGVSSYKVSWGGGNTATVSTNNPQDLNVTNISFTISDIALARVSRAPYVLNDGIHDTIEFSTDIYTISSYNGERTITLGAKPDLFTWGESDAMDSGNIVTGQPINYITTTAWNHMLDLIIHACHIPPNQLSTLRVSTNARFTAARYNQVGEILDKIHHALGLGTFFTGVNVNQPILPQHFNGQTSLKGGLNRIIQKYYTTSSTLNWSDIP